MSLYGGCVLAVCVTSGRQVRKFVRFVWDVTSNTLKDADAGTGAGTIASR